MEKSLLKKIYKKNYVKRYIELILGVLIMGVSFNMFLLPHNFVYGGVSGLAIIIQEIFTINPALFIAISSIIILVISYFVLDKEKTTGSVLGSILYPIAVQLTSKVPLYLNFDSSQLLLSALFGGVLTGIGAGLIYKAGFTTGGTDIINQIICKYFKMSIGRATIFSNGLILLCGTFVFGVNNFMYGVIILYIISMLTDKVLLGISDSKAFYIVTEKEEQVKEYILNNLSHGVTIFQARGGYDNKKQKVLFCVIPTKEYFKLKEGIAAIDQKAFFVVTDAYEVYGGE